MKVENKILPNEEQLKGFTDEPEKGPIKMLNLIKLKTILVCTILRLIQSYQLDQSVQHTS